MLYEIRRLCTSLLLNAFNHHLQFLLLIKYHICKTNSGEQVSLKTNRIDGCGGGGGGGCDGSGDGGDYY